VRRISIRIVGECISSEGNSEVGGTGISLRGEYGMMLDLSIVGAFHQGNNRFDNMLRSNVFIMYQSQMHGPSLSGHFSEVYVSSLHPSYN
jgi:hypothetical protein